MVSTMRLYGAAIALVSGGYALWRVSMANELDLGGWIMLVLGAIIIAHAVVLLTDEADRLGGASGPLMVVYAVIMLLIQGGRETGMMNGGTGMGPGMSPGGMGTDAGMVALAILMLVSGLIMFRGNGSTESTPRM